MSCVCIFLSIAYREKNDFFLIKTQYVTTTVDDCSIIIARRLKTHGKLFSKRRRDIPVSRYSSRDDVVCYVASLTGLAAAAAAAAAMARSRLHLHLQSPQRR